MFDSRKAACDRHGTGSCVIAMIVSLSCSPSKSATSWECVIRCSLGLMSTLGRQCRAANHFPQGWIIV